MLICVNIGGYTWEEADKMLKITKHGLESALNGLKKELDKGNDLRAKFFTNALEHGLTEEEIEIVKWGRNAKGAKTKHTDIVTYRLATGLEALIGKLYFAGKKDRIKEIMEFIVGEE